MPLPATSAPRSLALMVAGRVIMGAEVYGTTDYIGPRWSLILATAEELGDAKVYGVNFHAQTFPNPILNPLRAELEARLDAAYQALLALQRRTVELEGSPG